MCLIEAYQVCIRGGGKGPRLVDSSVTSVDVEITTFSEARSDTSCSVILGRAYRGERSTDLNGVIDSVGTEMAMNSPLL